MALQAYTFVKKCKGGLTITLDSYNFTAPRRDFRIPHGVESIVIPYVYAMGLFVSEGALNQFKTGYFEIRDIEGLQKEAATHGLLASEEAPKENIFDKVEKAIKGNKLSDIKSMLESKNTIAQSAIVASAFENRDTLNASVIKLIEEHCGITLRIEE